MRVALLMTGEGKQLWITSTSLNKYVIAPNDADIFLYLNKDSLEPQAHDDEEEIIKKVFPKNVKSLIFTDENYDKELQVLIDNNYSKIDAQYKKLNRDKWDKKLNWHNTCQYLKVKKCCEVAVDYANKNNFKYDLILRCRPDIGWLGHFNLLRPIEPDTLYCNSSLHNVGYGDKSHFVSWIEDTCFFGDQNTMLKICSDFSDKMVDELEICDENYDLTCATEKLLSKVIINSGVKIKGINEYFGYKGKNWIRPKLSKYFTNWEKSENFHLVEKYANGASGGLAVYFDRVGDNIILDETIIQ